MKFYRELKDCIYIIFNINKKYKVGENNDNDNRCNKNVRRENKYISK